MKKVRAFTLIEILVVIALIAILAALLLPVVNRVKTRSKATHCLSNLKQWGTATLLYVADNRDYLPPEGFGSPNSYKDFTAGWYRALPELLGMPVYWDQPWRTNAAVEPGRSIWLCPSNPRRSNGNNLFHYCLNEEHDGTGDDDLKLVKVHRFANPSAQVWMFDSKNLPALGGASFVHTNLHNGGAQFNFLDGHAQGLKKEMFRHPETDKPFAHPSLVWCGICPPKNP